MRVYEYSCGRERVNYNVSGTPMHVRRDYGCGYCGRCKRAKRDAANEARNRPTPERLIAAYWATIEAIRATITEFARGY